MNASDPPEPLHRAYLNLGSNIEPGVNLRRALELLRRSGPLLAQSHVYQTEAYGSSASDFYNMTVLLQTPLSAAEVKQQVITKIEQALGRVRTADKYAARTIDLDIIVFDGQVTDPEIWQRVYLAVPLGDLLPDLPKPQSGEPLRAVAQRLRASQRIERIADW